MTISACLLTRNEEATLAAAIRSLASIADQVVVMDTGSTDATMEIARREGAEVHSMGWGDDFGAGRNACLAVANGDWVLWINPTEEWVEPGRAALDRLTADDRVFGYFARVLAVGQTASGELPGESWDLRLFRRTPGVAYVGCLHPGFTPEFHASVDWSRYRVDRSPIALRSLSDPGPLDSTKSEWTLRLFDRELSQRPGQLRYEIERARLLAMMKDPRADAALASAGDAIIAVGESTSAPTGKVQHLLEDVLGGGPTKRLGALDRDAALRLTLRWFRDSPPLLWTLAGSHYARGEFAEAAAVLEHLVDLGERGAYDRSRPFPAEFVGDQARMNLASCYDKIGRIAQSRALLQGLLSSPTLRLAAEKNLNRLG